MPTDEVDRIRKVYRAHYTPDPADRNYPWHPRNPVSVYYRQAQEKALIRMLNSLEIELTGLRILDVGCGNGSLLRFLTALGAYPDRVFGVDLLTERLNAARASSPGAFHFQVGDANSLPFASESFGLVSQFTVFSSILDNSLRRQVATEMSRVLTPGGWLLWYDTWARPTERTRGVKPEEVLALFAGLKAVYRQALHPVRATRLAKWSVRACDWLDGLPGFPRTHLLALFRKT